MRQWIFQNQAVCSTLYEMYSLILGYEAVFIHAFIGTIASLVFSIQQLQCSRVFMDLWATLQDEADSSTKN